MKEPKEKKAKKYKRAFMVSSIKQTATVDVWNQKVELPFSGLADGCVGVSLWFDTLENALAYTDNDGTEIQAGQYEELQSQLKGDKDA
jgi:hypothetical protein